MKGWRKMIHKYAQVFAVALLVTGVYGLSVAGNPDSTRTERDVQAVAESYFQALQAGDRQTLLSLFSGKERDDLDSQTSDPAYVQFLVERYSDARLEVGDSGSQGSNQFVDVTIWLSNVEALRERLLLSASKPGRRDYKIVAREVLNK
jgi:hypothetical protein